jgi:hypothetical protein
MLWDPALVEQVYGGRPLPGLDPLARALLTRGDRRAWGTDPYRRARTLHALLEEFPCSAAEAGVAGLDAFFSSPAFHAAVMENRAMAPAFGRWLGGRGGAVLEVELAFAELRRAPAPPPPGPGELMAAPGSRPIALPEGTLDRYAATLAALGPSPVDRLLGGLRVPRRARGPGVEYAVLRVGRDGASAIPGSEGLHALLIRAARPCPRPALVAEARRLDATEEEANEILEDLLAEGFLVVGSDPPADA